MTYYATIHDDTGKRVTVLPFNQLQMGGFRLNQYNSPTFIVPKNDKRLANLVENKDFMLFHQNDLLFSGSTGRKAINGDTKLCTITGVTYERLLKQMMAPCEINLNGMDLGDAIRYLLRGWKTYSITTFEDFESCIDQVGTDIDTESGNMYLTRTPGQKVVDGVTYQIERFAGEGYRIFEIELGEKVTEVERIFWSHKIGEAKDEDDNLRATSTAYQYQTSRNDGPWSDWSVLIGKNAISTQPSEDGFPIVGFDNLSGLGNKIRVKIWLFTDNTTIPAYEWEDLDPQVDTNTLGITPEFRGLKLICRTAGTVTEGNIPVTGIKIKNFEISRTSHYNIIRQLCQTYKYEFLVDHLKRLTLKKEFGMVHKKPFRHGHDCSIEIMDENPLAIRNIIYGYGEGSWPDQLFCEYRDEVSIQKHGSWPDTLEDTSITTIADLQAACVEKAMPDPELEIEMTFPGGPSDRYVFLGDTIRIIKGEDQLDFTGRVAEWSCSVTPDGGKVVKVSLDTPAANLMDYVIHIKSLRSNKRNADIPSNVRGKGGYGYIMFTWSSNGDHDIAQTTQTPNDPQSWRNTGGKIEDHKLILTQLPVGTKMYIRVASVKDGKISPFSIPTSATTTALPPGDIHRPDPPTPTIGQISSEVYQPESGVIIISNQVTWTNPADADKITICKVERKELSDGPIVTSTTGPESPYNDTAVKPGCGYQYRLQFVNEWGKPSVWSQSRSVTTPSATDAPAKPTGVEASPYFSTIALRCNKNSDLGLAGYEWRCSAGVDPNTAAVIPGNKNTNSYTGTYGQSVNFWVRACTTIDSQTYYSEYSDIVTATPGKVDKADMTIFQDGILTPEIITDVLNAHIINVGGVYTLEPDGIKDSTGYTIVDPNGYNGKIISMGIFDNTNLHDQIVLGEVTVPTGWVYVCQITPLDGMASSRAEQAIDTFDDTIYSYGIFRGRYVTDPPEFSRGFGGVLQPGEYANLKVIVYHFRGTSFWHEDGTYKSYQRSYAVYYQVIAIKSA